MKKFSQTETLLMVSIAAGVGYFLGKRATSGAPTNKLPKAGRPPRDRGALPEPEDEPEPEPGTLPPAPVGDTGPIVQPGRDFSEFWEAIDHDVQIYPDGADETRIRPPSPQGLVASPSCDLIAVADQWWDPVGLFAAGQAFGQTDGDAVSRRVISRWLPDQCQTARTPAAGAIRTEIRDRLAALNPDLVFSEPRSAPID